MPRQFLNLHQPRVLSPSDGFAKMPYPKLVFGAGDAVRISQARIMSVRSVSGSIGAIPVPAVRA